jgi:hypothetical protein
MGPATRQARRALSDRKMKAPLRVATSRATRPAAGLGEVGFVILAAFIGSLPGKELGTEMLLQPLLVLQRAAATRA